MPTKYGIAALVVWIGFAAIPVHSQWIEQTIEIEQGWNAIFLEVEPYPNTCELLVQDVPIQSIWYYDQQFSPVQFIEDPNELTPQNPKWRSYFPPDHPEAVATNLYALDVGRSYLIQAREAFTWTIRGKPEFRRQRWNPDSYNLVGFYVDDQQPPTLSQWFAYSAAHNPLEIWQLNTNQRWERITDPASMPIEPGKAYWVRSNGVSDYQGPVDIRLTEGTELNYIRTFAEHTFELYHPGTGMRELQIETLASSPVPQAIPNSDPVDLSPIAGEVPLSYYGQTVQGAETQLGYMNLPATVSFAAGETAAKSIQLAVDRTAMVPTQNPDAIYQSILVIRDHQGYRRRIGVLSEGRSNTSSSTQAKIQLQQVGEPDPSAGLWVGFVNLNRVQEPLLSQTTETPAVFGFRMMVHVDAASSVRLLNEVTQIWRDGTYRPEPLPDDPNARVVEEPGYFILLTPSAPESLMDELRIGETVHPASLRDGRPFARRISSAMFSLLDENHMPVDPLMDADGSFGESGDQVSIVLQLDDSDPMNPFHHQYHPQHAYPAEGDPPAPGNSWTITREIALEFTETPPEGAAPAGWGDTEVGGIYREVLTGLKKDPILIEGSFRLERVSTVPVLNDGLTP